MERRTERLRRVKRQQDRFGDGCIRPVATTTLSCHSMRSSNRNVFRAFRVLAVLWAGLASAKPTTQELADTERIQRRRGLLVRLVLHIPLAVLNRCMT